MSKRSFILISISVILVVVASILLFGRFNKNKEQIKEYDAFSYENYVVLKGSTGKIASYDKSLYIEGYKGNYDEVYYIDGTLKSSNETKQKFVVVTFNLYDKSGNLLGEAIAGIGNVEKDKEYTFKAMSLTTTEDAKKVYRYDLKKIESK